MSNNLFTEEQYENALIQLFQEMGYQYECGYDVERNFREPCYADDLKQSSAPVETTSTAMARKC